MRVKTKSKPAKNPSPVPAGRTGASAALTRLETEEASLFTAYETAKAGRDALEIRVARDAWIKVSESLRRFDLMLEAARRETGELVPCADVERWLSNLGSCLHYALHRVMNGDLTKTLAVCDSAFVAFIQGYNPKRDAPFQDVPEWMYLALFKQRAGPGHAADQFYFYKKRSLIVSTLDQFPDDSEKAKAWFLGELAKLDAEKAAATKTERTP